MGFLKRKYKALIISLLAIMALVLLIIYSWMVAFTELGLTQDDRKFIAVLNENMNIQNPKVSVADIFPNDWDFICFIPEYERTSKTIMRYLKTRALKIDYEVGYDAVGNDNIWAVTFFKNPDKATVYSIPSNKFSYNSGGCADRESAYIEVTKNSLSQNFLSLKLTSN